MSFLRNDNAEILVAGHQNVLFRIDLDQACVLDEVANSLRACSISDC